MEPALADQLQELQYNDIAGLERSIDTAYKIASKRLFEVFIDKFKLLDHLNALRNYLMLGRGDFADQLMEALEYACFSSASNNVSNMFDVTQVRVWRSQRTHFTDTISRLR